MQLRGGKYVKLTYLEECPAILKEYLLYMETVKGRSANTVNGYFIDLRTFFRWLCVTRAGGDARQMSDDELHAKAKRTIVNLMLEYLESDVEQLHKMLCYEARL